MGQIDYVRILNIFWNTTGNLYSLSLSSIFMVVLDGELTVTSESLDDSITTNVSVFSTISSAKSIGMLTLAVCMAGGQVLPIGEMSTIIGLEKVNSFINLPEGQEIVQGNCDYIIRPKSK